MSYQVLARKWRPKRFEEVAGQRGVTQTLKNALASGRIAHAFIFGGPRGVGKTTTARILARGLNCVAGPTGDPCGTCDACLEIAEGRDIDVLEIDAATHTGIDNVRGVIIAGLGIQPARDRFKIFIIDEVHRFSPQAFDALLKSIEEPPPHVVFMMATTELHKVPDTIVSRSQVFELRAISTKTITDQLRNIASAEGISIEAPALALIARGAEGSMRDALSALDQVIAFAGNTISVDDVSVVLGLIGRDLLYEVIDAVASESAPAAFDLAARIVEAGHDLRLVCRELSRVVRDLMVLSIDPSRIDDPEIAPEGDRERLKALAARFSREDLMRAFDLLSRTENDIRYAGQPRYHLEMALLRWIHLRKLVPLDDLIESLEKGPSPASDGRPPKAEPPARPQPERRTTTSSGTPANPIVAERQVSTGTTPTEPQASSQPESRDQFKEAFLAEIRRQKKFLYGTVIAQAQKIETDGDRVRFAFAPAHRALRLQLEQNRAWLETLAAQIAGRRMSVVAAEGGGGDAAGSEKTRETSDSTPPDAKKAKLKAQALADAGVQAMMDVFGAEIRDVEEI